MPTDSWSPIITILSLELSLDGQFFPVLRDTVTSWTMVGRLWILETCALFLSSLQPSGGSASHPTNLRALLCFFRHSTVLETSTVRLSILKTTVRFSSESWKHPSISSKLSHTTQNHPLLLNLTEGNSRPSPEAWSTKMSLGQTRGYLPGVYFHFFHLRHEVAA